MTAGARTWTELRVRASAEGFAQLLVAGIAPFLREGPGGKPRRGHYIPDPDGGILSIFLDGREDPDREGAALSTSLHDRGVGRWVSGIDVLPGARTAIHEVQMTGSGAQEVVDDFLVDTTPFALSLVESAPAGGAARAAIAFDLMVSQPFALRGLLFERLRDLPHPLAFVSYRSHVDGFFVLSKNPAATRQAFEDRYLRSAEALRGRLDAVAAQIAGNAAPISRPVRDWWAIVDRYGERVRLGICAGTLVTTFEQGDGYMGDNFDLAISPFHQVIQADPAVRALATRDPDFNTMRVMVSLLYLTLHRFGVRLAERYLLCYSAARTFETRYRIGPAEAISQFAELLYRRPEGAGLGEPPPERPPLP